jgi:hypothetical protein
MPRISIDEKLTALQNEQAGITARRKEIARDIRKLKNHQKNQERSDRAHVGIVVGVGTIEHARRNPGSEVWRLCIRLLEYHLAQQPNDKPIADTLAELKALAETPASVTLPDAAE